MSLLGVNIQCFVGDKLTKHDFRTILELLIFEGYLNPAELVNYCYALATDCRWARLARNQSTIVLIGQAYGWIRRSQSDKRCSHRFAPPLKEGPGTRKKVLTRLHSGTYCTLCGERVGVGKGFHPSDRFTRTLYAVAGCQDCVLCHKCTTKLTVFSNGQVRFGEIAFSTDHVLEAEKYDKRLVFSRTQHRELMLQCQQIHTEQWNEVFHCQRLLNAATNKKKRAFYELPTQLRKRFSSPDEQDDDDVE